MKKLGHILMIGLVLVVVQFPAKSYGQLLTFEFSGLAGNETSVSSITNHSALMASSLSRGSGLSASPNSGRFNATNWALTSIANAISGNQYMEFTITPIVGHQFSVSSVTIQFQRSGTGNSAIVLRSSLDNYATDLDTVKMLSDITSTQSFTFTFLQANSSSGVTYRFYSYAEASIGSGGIGDGSGNDLIVNGTASPTGANLNITPATYNFGTATVGTPSASISFSISGSNLSNAPSNVTITQPNSDFQLSLDNIAWSSSLNIVYHSPTLDSTGFYVRFNPQTAGIKSGDLFISGGGVVNPPIIGLSGTATITSYFTNIVRATDFTEPENISYVAYQTNNISYANSIETARFTIQDGGNDLNDADSLASIVTAITFNLSNHDILRRIALYDSATELAELTADTILAFNNLNIIVPDNETKSLSIRVAFANSVTDRAQFSFSIIGVAANLNGSQFATADGGAPFSNTSGDYNKIQVTATNLSFIQQPSNGNAGSPMTPAILISANDSLGNRDLDFAADVQITSSGSLSATPAVQTAVAGLATFNALIHVISGLGLKLTAALHPSFGRAVESNTFDIIQLPANGDIVINQFSQDYDLASDEYVELVNKTNKSFDLSLLKLSYQSSSGGPGSAGGNLDGILLPYSFWLLSTNDTISVGLTQGLGRDGAFTAGFASGSGQIALQIIADNTIIDAVGYGTISGGTFTEGGNISAMTSPSGNGGGKRTTEGADTNNNTHDFSNVPNAAIDLRNSSSRLAVSGSNIPAGNYTDLIVAGDASLAGTVQLMKRLILIDGVLTTNGHLILKSTSANHTANVVGGTNASISGNVTVQRTLPWTSANNNGFRFVSHPFSSNPQLSTISNLPTGANTVIKYDEDLNITQGGYIVLNNRSVSLEQAKSIGVWTNAANTLSYSGPLQLDALASVAVDFAGTSTGWNFMGNPFPSTLDWDQVLKSTTVNNATYVWIKDNLALGGGHWGTYINGTAANGDSRFLAPAQGFVIKATGNSPAPTLFFPAAARVSNPMPSYNITSSYPDELRIRVNNWNNGTRFETVVKFSADASAEFDPQHDAELMSDGRTHTPDLYTLDKNGGKYTIQTLPLPSGEHQMLPLQLESFGQGSFSFDVDLTKLHAVGKVELQDTKQNRFTHLVNNSQIVFTTDANDAIDRFILHFNRVERSHNNVHVGENRLEQVKVFSYENEIFVRGIERADNCRIVDLTGRPVFEISNPVFTSGSINSELASGIYLVQLTLGGTSKTFKIVLH